MKIIMKYLFVFTILITTVGLLCGCTQNLQDEDKSDDTYKIVCTFFAQYDWIKNITDGIDDISVSLLCDNGTDMHSYQMTAGDMLEISQCDMLVCIGGESDKWAKEAALSSGVKYISLMDLLGMSEHSHNHDEEENEAHIINEENDEHVWLSPKKADILVTELSKVIQSGYSHETDEILVKAQEYCKNLQELDSKYAEVCENAGVNVMVVADRFPFSHLVHDYGVECYAAFPGCSADTNAGFQTIIELAGAVDSNLLKYVVVTENSDMKTANAVISATQNKNQQICVLDSMQSVVYKDKTDVSYIDIMGKNLEVLKKVLVN